MNRKENASKRAVEELFSNSTEHMNDSHTESPIITDKREELKNQMLGISPDAFEKHSAVSKEVSANVSDCRDTHTSPDEGFNFERDNKRKDLNSSEIHHTGTIPRVNANTGTIPRVSANTGTIPRVNANTGTIPRVNANTGTIPRVSANTGTIPRVSANTGTIPRVSANTGTIPRVSANTGTIPRVSANTGTIPRVSANTGTIPRVSANTDTIPKTAAPSRKRKNDGSNKKKSHIWIIPVSVIAVLAVVFGTILTFRYLSKDKTVPADTSCGLGAVISSPDTASYMNSEDAYISSSRYNVRFTFYEAPDIVCTTTETTVGSLMDKLGIELDEMKRVSSSREDTVTGDLTVDIKTLSYATAMETEPIAYDTSYIDIQTIPRGSTSLKREGANGTTTYTYKCLLVNGEEESRELVDKAVTKNPVDRILYRGVGGTVVSGGQTYNFSYYIDVTATTYSIVGTTASGLPTSESVMAVDPRVIRLGTACVVKGASGDFGYRIAADTGGDIKGNKIDIWLPEGTYPGGFGWRAMRVYILG